MALPHPPPAPLLGDGARPVVPHRGLESTAGTAAVMMSGLPTLRAAASCQVGRKRRQDLWTHFCYLPAERKTECIVPNEDGEPCRFKFAGKNTTNLKRHLKTRHPSVSDKVNIKMEIATTACAVSFRIKLHVDLNNLKPAVKLHLNMRVCLYYLRIR